MRQILTTIKGKMDRNTIIVGYFNTPLTPMDTSSKQKINKEKQALSDTLKQLDLINMYRGFHLKTVDFTYFSNAHTLSALLGSDLTTKENVQKRSDFISDMIIKYLCV